MSTFRIGQRLVCIAPSAWAGNCGAGDRCAGPAKGEVVTCDGDSHNSDYIYLKEHADASINGRRNAYYAEYFRPLIEDLTAELARKEAARIQERPDIIHQPQPLES